MDLKCPVCGGSRLTPATNFGVGSGNAHPVVQMHDPTAQGLLGVRFPEWRVNRARVCRECGYVLGFLDEAQRADLDARADQYQPYTR